MSARTHLPTIYKLAKSGAIQVCNISHYAEFFFVEYGILDGKMQEQETECFPKNVGRSNETTALEQSALEAKSKWQKKVDSGYSINIEAPVIVKLPMKVKPWPPKKMPNFPVVSTDKYNGVNGTFRLVNNEVHLYSRGGKRYPDIVHLEPQIEYLFEYFNTNELNAELYIDGLPLQEITSAVSATKDSSKRITAEIFDISGDTESQYRARRVKLMSFEKDYDQSLVPNVKMIYGVVCKTLDDIEAHYNDAISRGMEGTVIKDLDGLYQHNIRSSYQWKYKKAQDAEFKVVAIKQDKHGHPVYQCIAQDNALFWVKRKGTAEDKLHEMKTAEQNIGKWLKVEFEVYSNAGIPLKPVGLLFRECDNDGNPLT